MPAITAKERTGGVISVMIVDDHPVVRKGLAAMIGDEPGLKVVAECRSAEEAVTAFREKRPDITLMDLRLPQMGGVDAIRILRREFEGARFIVLTTYDGDEDIHRALQSGAQGYVLKDTYCDEILDAIRTVHAGGRFIPRKISERLSERVPGFELTARELDVLKHIARGQSNREIGLALSIGEGTVKTHVVSILGKLGASDRTEAATLALQRGIIRF